LDEQVLADLEQTANNTVSSQVYADAYPITQAEPTAKATKAKTSQPRTYKVKRGDTLYSIASKFTGVSHKDLMKANKLKSATVKVGQTIRIPEV
jgi:membrane-bound lytic murein transglycosylase D